MFVRALYAVNKKFVWDIKKHAARNPWNSPTYFFDKTYTTNGEIEYTNEYIILNRDSGLTFKIDWYIVGNNEMLRHASSAECPNTFQCKLFNVVWKK